MNVLNNNELRLAYAVSATRIGGTIGSWLWRIKTLLSQEVDCLKPPFCSAVVLQPAHGCQLYFAPVRGMGYTEIQ